jgi:hypothetical protein
VSKENVSILAPLLSNTVSQVANMYGSPRLGISPNITDSRWHMLTLTTQPDGGKGYQMYIDGNLVAQMAPSSAPYEGIAHVVHFSDTSLVLTLT